MNPCQASQRASPRKARLRTSAKSQALKACPIFRVSLRRSSSMLSSHRAAAINRYDRCRHAKQQSRPEREWLVYKKHSSPGKNQVGEGIYLWGPRALANPENSMKFERLNSQAAQ